MECQRARKAKWHKKKLKEDEVYKENQKMSQRKWLDSNSGYYKEYRRKNPEKTKQNRVHQKIRDFSKKVKHIENKGSKSKNLAKMDASNSLILQGDALFCVTSPLAKMDALFKKISKHNSVLVGLAKMDFIEGTEKNMLPLKNVPSFFKEKHAEKNFKEGESEGSRARVQLYSS